MRDHSKKTISFFFWLTISYFYLVSNALAQKQIGLHLNNLQHIGVEHGLSSNKVNCIFQDKKGFIWIGTDYGLNRFDGYSFKVFTRKEGDTNSLTDNNITCLAQDAAGNIWIGTINGLNIMNYKTGKISPAALRHTKYKLSTYNISSLASDESSFWIGTISNGLFQYKVQKQELIKHEKTVNGTFISDCDVSNIVIESNGNVLMSLIGCVNGLTEFDVKTNLLNMVSLDKKIIIKRGNYTRYSSNDEIQTIYKDSQGNIYIGTQRVARMNTHVSDSSPAMYAESHFQGETYFKKNSENTYKQIKAVNSKKQSKSLIDAISFVEYKPGQIVCFGYGYCTVLSTIDNQTGTAVGETVPYPRAFIIEKTFKDRSGKLWFITSEGIATQEPHNLDYELFAIPGFNPNSLVEDAYGTIWIGTNDSSLSSFDRKRKKHEKFNTKNKLRGFAVSTYSTDDIIYGIGNFLDVYAFNKRTHYFARHSGLKKLVDPKSFAYAWNDLIPVSDGSLWAKVYKRGIGRIDQHSGVFSVVINNDALNGGGSDHDFPFVDDKKGNFYHANFAQIVKVNYETAQFKIIDISKHEFARNSAGNHVASLAVDTRNNLWIGTTKMGLWYYDFSKGKLYRYSIKDGLPTNNTSRILFIDNALWVCHESGIYKFIPPTKIDDKSQKPTINAYSAKDGLLDISYSVKAMIHCRDGSIVLGANNKLISFHPDSIKINNYLPPVVITSLQINNKTIDESDADITSTDTLRLSYKQNNISLEFAALNFIHAEFNQYAYKMSGLDISWIYCGKRRFVNYSNLNAGQYVFQVKAANNEGLWNEQGTKLVVIVSPPWWQTWWAYSIYVIVILLIIALLFRLYTASLREKKKKAELQQKISETEMKALRSQMNPHFIFNALQSIQTFLMAHKPDDANAYLLKFSKLIRLVLENSQLSGVSLKDDMRALELYMQLESIRLTYPFTFKFHVDEAIDVEETTVPSLILQPVVENAIWHGLQYKPAPGHIDIFISNVNDALVAVVQDNGIGRNAARKEIRHLLVKQESLGLKLTEDRLKILNEPGNVNTEFRIVDLFNNDNTPAGTRVEILLPLKR